MSFWILGSGQIVFDRKDSHLHGPVAELLPQVFSEIHLTTEFFSVVQVDFDFVVGKSVCISTQPDDEVVFAQRLGRIGLSRFVKNREPEPTKSVVVILKKAEDGNFVLITAFIGEKPEPEPWDRNATVSSVPFWNTHALVWGSEPVVPGSETDICPWEKE